MYKILEDIERERKLDETERAEMKKYKKLSDAFTPLGKAMTTEYANQNAYDCIQVHGGSGYMKDYPCERLYRDARITNIYEGTTQMQVIAAIRHVLTGTFLAQMQEYQAQSFRPEFDFLKSRLNKLKETYEQLVLFVVDIKDNEIVDFQARRLVEAAGHIIMGYLLLLDSNRNYEAFIRSAEVYIAYGEAEVHKIQHFIRNFDPADLDFFRQL
jgi:hypothetical protein